ncbi:ABC transporter family substrate-binding protein [Corynebacterium striatum]|uniref:ABC transporter family substrate-binding protein n=1 Tax=Corynebacterium striatum TaxID=43770 RepID=UPI000A8E501E|nr:ABC transporter family substrate-binding protein [Corynebacterium striatum]
MQKLSAATLIASMCVLTSCMANPGPPPVEEKPAAESTETETPTPVEEEESTERETVAIGVDPLSSGLNPHLVANNNELVSQIAELVLPSAFHGEHMDTDILASAEEVQPPEGVAQRVVYKIASPAQWSDGTPISGSDFHYLWTQMTSTAGVSDAAAYYAIKEVNTSSAGRVVTVDFSERVADWHSLFAHLLPSHLLQDAEFTRALADGIPASAGRYSVAGVDRGRGVITLNRNDRFWGADPALVDVVQLRTVRNTGQAVDMLRSGQVGFVDFTPEQTSLENLSLLSNVNAGTVTRGRQLRLHLSARQSALPDERQRRALASLIETDQVARLAAGRASELRPGQNPVSGDVELAPLRERAGRKPLRIAADPTNSEAMAAARTIVDVLEAQAISAEVVSERTQTITGTLLPRGEVDALVSWESLAVKPATMASHFLCEEAGMVFSDFSGFCPENSEATVSEILSGRISPEEGLERVRKLNAEQVLYVPLMDEVRIHALGRGIVGPGQSIEDWDAGLVTAPTWRKDEQ